MVKKCQILLLFTLFRIYMKNATIFILYKILIGSLWGRQLANKPAAFLLVMNRQPTQYVEQREAPPATIPPAVTSYSRRFCKSPGCTPGRLKHELYVVVDKKAHAFVKMTKTWHLRRPRYLVLLPSKSMR